MSRLLQDIKLALRGFRRAPVATAIIVFTLALGLGGATAIWTALDTVLLRPLPYPEGDRLVQVHSQFPGLGFDRFWVSPPEYFELGEWNQSYAHIGGYRAGEVSLTGGDRPLRVNGAILTASLFSVLGVEPAMGRVFTAEEDIAGGPSLVVLGNDLWRSAFAADPQIVGRTIEVNGQAATVIGVMPAGFDIADEKIKLFRPMQLDSSNRQNRGSHYLNVIARLKPEVGIESARAELEQLVVGWRERIGTGHVPSPDNHPYILGSLHDGLVGSSRPALFALLGAVGLVLLIVCANIANVLLARADTRGREMALRMAIGASRARLFRQLLTESLLLAGAGGLLGLLTGNWALRQLVGAFPGSLPRTSELALDSRVLLATFGITTVVGVLFGLAPALRLSRSKLMLAVQEAGQRTARGGFAGWLRRGLVVAQFALAVSLVLGAGLFLRSLNKLLDVDPGFEPERLVTFTLSLAGTQYGDPGTRLDFFRRLQDDLAAQPGVEAAGALRGLPPMRDVDANDTDFESIDGATAPDGTPPENVDFWQVVTPESLSALGVRLVSGREITASDDAQAQPVVLVNQTLTKTYWPDRDAIGQRLKPGFGEQIPWFTVVGVVEDIHQKGLDQPVGTELFLPYNQAGPNAPRTMNVFVRTALPADQVASVVTSAVARIDPGLPLGELRTMDRVILGSVSRSRLLTTLIAVFGGLALFLAALGIYGVLSYLVASRRRELGVRMALGADRGSVLAHVLGNGLSLALLGVAVGLAVSYAMARSIESLLFGVDAHSPSTYLAVCLALLAAAVLACWLPAFQASRVDPADVLRSE